MPASPPPPGPGQAPASVVQQPPRSRFASGVLLAVLGLALVLSIAATAVNNLAQVSFIDRSAQVSLILRPFGTEVCIELNGVRQCVGIPEIEAAGDSTLESGCLGAIRATAGFEVMTLIMLLITIALQVANLCTSNPCLSRCQLAVCIFDIVLALVTVSLALATPQGPCTLSPLPISWTTGTTAILWVVATLVTLGVSIAACALTCCCRPIDPRAGTSAPALTVPMTQSIPENQVPLAPSIHDARTRYGGDSHGPSISPLGLEGHKISPPVISPLSQRFR